MIQEATALFLPELQNRFHEKLPYLTSRMAQLAIVTDLPRSLAFYQKLFGLTIIERPPFKNAGAWLACGDLQVHLSLYSPGSFRTGNVDGADCHFAFRTDDFDGALATLTASGFREDAAETTRCVSWSAATAPVVFLSFSCSIPTATSSRSTERHNLTRESAASVPRRESHH
jgi:glyoxalase/bleomycin resistance protein/dioxygenase superfamily protein